MLDSYSSYKILTFPKRRVVQLSPTPCTSTPVHASKNNNSIGLFAIIEGYFELEFIRLLSNVKEGYR
jgi:hypothetical protein